MKRAKPRKTARSEFPVNISHPEKVFWPDDGYTKGDLARYYQEIFPKLEPYVDDRILSMERCPDGILGSCFYQKEMPKGMPAGTPSKRIKHVGKSAEYTNYVVGGSLATQLALVNLGCIAVHVAGTRASSGRKPDWVCFDLDPQSGKFSDSAQAAVVMKEALDTLKLTSYAKTSGSRGVHIFIPIRLGPDADEVLSFAQAVVARVAAAHPKDLTVEHSIAARGQRVYLDPFRNGFGQTVVAPYSVRRRPKAPFSTPLEWSELKPSLDPADFNLDNYQKRLKRADPWKDFFKDRQSLKTATLLLKKL
jgi:bifunctional non-homologous end joining protein LigD